jgi:DNA-binding response OmpR family regulator
VLAPLPAPRATIILPCDLDHDLGRRLRAALGAAGYACSAAADLVEASEDVARPRLVILAAPTVGRDDWAALRRLRSRSGVPVVVLLDAGADARARALELGADDCLGTACHPRELVARVQAVLRRSAPRRVAAPGRRRNGRAPAGDPQLEVDRAARQVRVRGRPLELRPAEFELIATLATRPGVVFSRAALRGAAQNERTVEARVRAARDRLRGTGLAIVTVRGAGYKLMV